MAVTGTYGSVSIACGWKLYVHDRQHERDSASTAYFGSNDHRSVYVPVVDAGGLTSLATLTVTIQGANDNPIGVNDTATATEAGGVANGTAGSNGTGNVLTNDTDVDSAGNGETKAVNGVAAGAVGAAAGNVGVAVTGTYGSVSIASDGSYTYTIDNTNATVQALRTSGQTITDLFTYRVVDAGGLTSLATLTVTIQGANDNPVGVNDTATATEAGGVANGTAGSNGTGNVLTNDTDVDSAGNGETKAVNGVAAGLSVLRQVMSVCRDRYLRVGIDRVRWELYVYDRQLECDSAGAAYLGANDHRSVYVPRCGCGWIDEPSDVNRYDSGRER